MSGSHFPRRTLQLILRRHEFQPLEIGLGLEMEEFRVLSSEDANDEPTY